MGNACCGKTFLIRLAMGLAWLLPLSGCTADSFARAERPRYNQSVPAAGAVFSEEYYRSDRRAEPRYRDDDGYRARNDEYEEHEDDYDDDDDYSDDDYDDEYDDDYARPRNTRPVVHERPVVYERPAVYERQVERSPYQPARVDSRDGMVRRVSVDAEEAPRTNNAKPSVAERARNVDPDKKPAPPAPPPKPPRKPGLMDELTMGMMAIRADDFEPKPLEMPMSLQHVAASVLRNNRTIQVAAYRPEQAKAGVDASKAVYDPELFGNWNHSRTDASPAMIISGQSAPNREFRNEVSQAGIRQHLPTGGDVRLYHEWNRGTERNPGGARSDGNGKAYVMELTQPILNGFADAENKALIEISKLQVNITEEELRQTMIETMTKALTAYWEVAQAREEIRINKESLDMAERLLEREMGRKDEGISTQLDVDRAKEAVATRAYNLVLAKEQQRTAQENLKYLVNDSNIRLDKDVFIEVTESLESPLVRINLDKAIDVALKNRPEMKNADLSIRTSEVRRDYAKHSLLPKLNLVGQLRRNGDDNDTPSASSTVNNVGTDWTVGVEFSMPIGNQKARANLRQAESEMAQMQEKKRDARDYIISEVKTVVKNMELVVREIPLNERAVSSARKVLEGEWAKLELNQTGNRDLLQAQDLVAVTERNYITSQVRYNIHVINLFAAQGTLLEKMGIRLK